MNFEHQGSELAQALDARIDATVRSEPLPPLSGDQAALLDLADLLWESTQAAPPLDQDPTAILLGLAPDPAMSLEGRALARVRKNVRVDASALASALSAEGWEVTVRDIARWEMQHAGEVSPALIRAIAAVLGTKPEAIIRPGTSTRPVWLEELVGSESFGQLVKRWAQLEGVQVLWAAQSLESKLLATVNRGGRPDPEVLLSSLEAFVSAVEGSTEQ